MFYQIASSVLILIGLGLLAFELRNQRRPHALPWYRSPSVTSKILGLITGLLIRLCFAIPQLDSILSVMSFGFLFLTPFVVGFVSVYARPRSETLGFTEIVFGPWLPTILSMAIAGMLGFEGAICLGMALPIWLVLASAGGGAGALLRSQSGQPAGAFATVLVFAPLLAAAWESRIGTPENEIFLLSETEIFASSSRVWKEIASVPEIKKDELSFSLSSFLGFPEPIAATLRGSGVGAVRHATFSGGVEFIERITEWKTNSVIAFDIDPNTEKIPATTLDPHVTIGGEFFDVLSGRYEIILSTPESVRLRLYSRHRLSTHFNWYAELWARIIMGSIQEQILSVIKKRAEVPLLPQL